MPRGRTALAVLFLLLTAAAAGALAAGTGAATSAPARKAAPALRVDELGYVPGEAKLAYVIARVHPRRGDVHRAPRRRRRGPARHGRRQPRTLERPLPRSAAARPLGRWTRRARTASASTAPAAPSARVPHRRAGDAVPAARARDACVLHRRSATARDVIPGPLHRNRRTSTTARARVYDWPTYENADSDVIVGDSLSARRAGRPRGRLVRRRRLHQVHAHDRLRGHAAARVAARARRRRRPPPSAARPASGCAGSTRRGTSAASVMYIQVGIGSGNQARHVQRRPRPLAPAASATTAHGQAQPLPAQPARRSGPTRRARRCRRTSPAASRPPYALAAQVDAARAPCAGSRRARQAAAVFAAAKTAGVRRGRRRHGAPARLLSRVVLARRHGARGGRARAGRAGARRRPHGRLARARRATGRASTWRHEAGHDTLNLYDTSALAHADLVRAHARPAPGGAGVGEDALLADLRAQLGRGVARASGDPFGAGVTYDDFDAAPHAFGLVATARLYRSLTGDARYDAFATAQRDWALGGTRGAPR